MDGWRRVGESSGISSIEAEGKRQDSGEIRYKRPHESK